MNEKQIDRLGWLYMLIANKYMLLIIVVGAVIFLS